MKQKVKGNWLWRLQRGNPVEWHKGHLKGTGTVVKPLFDAPAGELNGKPFYGLPDAFEVRDDATGVVSRFELKELAAYRKKPK